MQKTIYLPEGQKDLAFNGLCHLLTGAQSGLNIDDPEYQAEYEKTYKNLNSDVASGALKLQNCPDLKRLQKDVYADLADSQVLVSDLQGYLQDKGIAIAAMLELELKAAISKIPSELLCVQGNAQVLFTNRIGRQFTETRCVNAGDLIASEEARIARQHAGFYKVCEAAQMLAEARPGDDVKDTIHRLTMATVNGVRIVRDPVSHFPLKLGDAASSDYNLVKAVDVDSWLNQLGVGYGFPPLVGATVTNTKYKYWLAVEDGQLVRFSDLPQMMANALHPEGGLAYDDAYINLEEELKLAVSDGLLKVRNPAGLGFLTSPHGDALQRAVLNPSVDLKPFLNARAIELRISPHGNGPNYWTLENAAAAMQAQLNWHDGTRAEFQDQIQEAAQSGALVILDPRTCLPVRLERVHTYWEYVTPDSVNKWLASLKAPYRWEVQPVETPAPEVTVRGGVGDGLDAALLASREQLIAAFGPFVGMNATWFTNVKDTPALLAARKVTGQGGRGHITEPRFCPFEVLQWLINPARRKGRMLSEHKGWELFEAHFPRSYADYSVGDPRTN